MSERMVLTIGWLPNDSITDTVVVGDSTASKNREIDLEIVDETLRGIGFNAEFQGAGLDWFDDSCAVFGFLRTLILKELGPVAPSTPLLAKAWALFQWELSEDVPEFLLIRESEAAAEFSNDEGQYNGCIYLRYVLEDGAETFGEQLVVVRPELH